MHAFEQTEPKVGLAELADDHVEEAEAQDGDIDVSRTAAIERATRGAVEDKARK